MKKLLSIILVISILCVCFVACGNKETAIDYPDAASFEADLNNGKDLTGKTVSFSVKEFVPDSAFGYNMQAGEHLNFCSEKNPGVKKGDKVSVKVTEIESLLGSYIISYELIK